MKHTAEEVSQFTNEVKQAGGMDGRAIEGFVIRCRLTADDSVFFFKIKYEEVTTAVPLSLHLSRGGNACPGWEQDHI